MTNTNNGDGKKDVKEQEKAETPVEEIKPAGQAEATEDAAETPAPEGEKAEENGLTMEFTVEVTNREIEADFNEALQKYASEVKMPGFRQGKVPMEVVKSRFKDAITEEVENKLIEKAVFEKIQKENIKIASHPMVKTIDREENGIKAGVTVELLPTVEIPDLETLEVEIPADELKTDEYNETEQIDAVLEAHRRQNPVLSREVQTGDSVRITYQSKNMKTKRMSPKSNSFVMVDEKETFEILDLSKELIGKRADDQLTVTRTYPEDYHKKKWAGHEMEHYIKIDSVFEMVKPELDETFVKSVGLESVDDFKTKLKEEYDKAMKDKEENIKMKHIFDKLTESVDFKVPSSLIQQEVSRLMQRQQQYMPHITEEGQAKAFVEAIKSDAEKSVKQSFIMQAVNDKYKIEVKNEDLEAYYKKIAEQNNYPLKEIRKFYLQKEHSEKLKDQITQEKLTELLKEKIQVKVK